MNRPPPRNAHDIISRVGGLPINQDFRSTGLPSIDATSLVEPAIQIARGIQAAEARSYRLAGYPERHQRPPIFDFDLASEHVHNMRIKTAIIRAGRQF